MKGEKVHELVKTVKQKMDLSTKNSSLEPWDRVSAAVGICVYDPAKHHETNDVFKEADRDMYRDKKRMHAGRD